jgi:hypothetical protein
MNRISENQIIVKNKKRGGFHREIDDYNNSKKFSKDPKLVKILCNYFAIFVVILKNSIHYTSFSAYLIDCYPCISII